jgi:hypothetical protein
MREQFIALVIVALVSIGGGLYLLREARRYRARRDQEREREQPPGA